MRSRFAIVVLCAAASTAACRDDAPVSSLASDVTGDPSDGDGIGITCDPGEQLPCLCRDGLDGIQICGESGAELSACVCEEPGSSSATGSSSSTSSSTGADTSSSTGSGSGTPAGVCSDGVVDETEQCDDDNRRDDDACTNDCVALCGPQWVAIDLSVGGVAPSVSALDPGTGRIFVAGRHLAGAARGTGYLGATGSRSGEFGFSRVLGFDDPQWTAMAVAGDGSIALVGRAAGEPLVTVLDTAGVPVWQRALEDVDQADPRAVMFDDSDAPIVGARSSAGVVLRAFDDAGETSWTQPLPEAIDISSLAPDLGNSARALTRGADAKGTSPLALETIGAGGVVGTPTSLGRIPATARLAGLARVEEQRWYVGLNLSATVFELVEVDADEVERDALRSDTLGLARSEAVLVGFGPADDGLVLALHHRTSNLVSVVRTDARRAILCERAMVREDEPPAVPVVAPVDANGALFLVGVAEGDPLRPWLARFR